MTTRDLLKLSTRIFTARKGRTALTILGMGIGFGTILFLVSLGYGLQDALLQNISSSGALTALDVTPNEADGVFLSPQSIDEMKEINGVEGVETAYDFSARLKLGDTSSDTEAEVATPKFIDLEGVKIAAGDELESESTEKDVLVSSAIGKIFEKSPEELIGQKISFTLLSPQGNVGQNISADDYIIKGVTESEDSMLYIPAQSLSIPSDINFTKAKVLCASSDVLNSVKDEISQKGFSVSSLSETVTEVNRLFRVVNIILGLFGIITLIVSAIGMFNTMTVALLERTTEIGIMRSIGASKMDILSMFIIESTLMGFCGGLVGLILGISSGQVVNLIINMAAKYFGGKPLDLFAYPLWFLGFVLLFSILIGFVTGIAPAKRASSLDPLEALGSK
jgi:putative ABC transport system permease protein